MILTIYVFVYLFSASYKKVSCKDLGNGDCEGYLYRYCPKGTLPFSQWRFCWCVLQGGTLYVFKGRDVSAFDRKNQIENESTFYYHYLGF